MRKNKKYMQCLFALITVLYVCQYETWKVKAEKKESSSQVSYVEEKAIAYRICVDVIGDGEVRYEKDGQQYVIRGKTVDILLASYESITITLAPDEDKEVKSIVLNGETLNNSKNEITIEGKDGAQSLEVEFSQQEDEMIESIQNTIAKGEEIIVPKTGASMGNVGKVSVISLCICMYAYRKKNIRLDSRSE